MAGFCKAISIPCVTDVEESKSSGSEDDSDVPGIQAEIAALFVSNSEKEYFDEFDERLLAIVIIKIFLTENIV